MHERFGIVQHVRAWDRDQLAETPETKTISKADLKIDEVIPTAPTDPISVVLQSGEPDRLKEDVIVLVTASFVPLDPGTAVGRLEDPEASIEGDKLRQSINLGSQLYSLDELNMQDLSATASPEARSHVSSCMSSEKKLRLRSNAPRNMWHCGC